VPREVSAVTRKYRLTDGAVKACRAEPREYEVHDTLADGLRLRVGRGGTKSWSVFYHRDGRNRRLGLGKYPVVSLTQARAKAGEALGKIKGPERGDPAREVALQRSAPLFGELADLFLRSQHFETRAVTTKKELRRIVEVELRPQWGSRRLSSIERHEIQRWGDLFASEGRGYMANRCREYMQLVWHWGLSRADLTVPPSPFYKLPKPFLGEVPRDRVLSHAEIRAVFEAIQREPRITAAWWAMLFLTAARDRSEVLRLEKREIDRDRKVLIIPREKTKGKRALVLPLSPWALEVLDAVLPLSRDLSWVFPGPRGDRPMTSTRRAAARLQERAGIEFQLRDIRRTVASGMTEIGIDPETVDRVLNHAIPSESRVTKVYQTSLMWAKLNEKRSALERWAEHLDQVILKGRGREIVRQAISTARNSEGWNSWASMGRLPKPLKPRETWSQRKARLESEGRDLVAEHRMRQAALRRSRRPRETGRPRGSI
jgi:integrase